MPPINRIKQIFIKEKNIIDHWFDSDERLRFVITASANMGFRYLLFVALGLIFTTVHYQILLLIMWLASSVIAFYSYKKLVFTTEGNHLKEYIKSILVWILSYFINAGILSLLVSRWNWNIFLAQAVAILSLLVTNYLLFKHFAFRKEKPLTRWEKLLSMFDIIKK